MPRGRPLSPAPKYRLKSGTVHRLQIMPEGDIEYPAAAVVDCEEHRLVPSGAGERGIGPCRGEHFQLLGRAAQRIVEFVGSVRPDFGQTGEDGMPGLPGHNSKLMTRTVMPGCGGTGNPFGTVKPFLLSG